MVVDYVVEKLGNKDRPVLCKFFVRKDGSCKKGCYEEKVMKGSPCLYDDGEQRNCSCYK